MPKPVRFIVFALFRDQKEHFFPSNLFSRFCLLQIEKIRRNETRSAKRRECFIVRRASIEFLLFVCVVREREGKFNFRGFLGFVTPFWSLGF